MAAILIVDDEEGLRETLEFFLTEEGYDVTVAGNYNEAVEKISRKRFDVIFADIILGGKTGIDLLAVVRDRNLTCPVVIITGYPSINTASEAVRLGAFDYIPKPVEKKNILRTARIALEHKKIIDKSEKYRKNLEAIFRSVEDGIITVNNELEVIALNEAAEKICGISGQPPEKPFADIIKNCRVRECMEALENTVKQKKPFRLPRLECHTSHRAGQVVTVNINPLIGSENEFCGAVMVVKDETRLARLEFELKERYKFHNLIGKSKQMQEVYSLVEKLAIFPTTVLITGESGTGKELVAEALHYKGYRKSDCSLH